MSLCIHKKKELVLSGNIAVSSIFILYVKIHPNYVTTHPLLYHAGKTHSKTHSIYYIIHYYIQCTCILVFTIMIVDSNCQVTGDLQFSTQGDYIPVTLIRSGLGNYPTWKCSNVPSKQ